MDVTVAAGPPAAPPPPARREERNEAAACAIWGSAGSEQSTAGAGSAGEEEAEQNCAQPSERGCGGVCLIRFLEVGCVVADMQHRKILFICSSDSGTSCQMASSHDSRWTSRCPIDARGDDGAYCNADLASRQGAGGERRAEQVGNAASDEQRGFLASRAGWTVFRLPGPGALASLATPRARWRLRGHRR
jgi:hypothetical protein